MSVEPDKVVCGQRKMSGPRKITYVSKPTARPREAPIAIVGRKIPAGTYFNVFNGKSRQGIEILPSIQMSKPLAVA